MEKINFNLKLHDKTINLKKHVFVIAEAGVNHNNDLKLAYRMIDAAVESKADAIKFQTFITDKIQLKNSIKPNYQKKIKGHNYYEIIKNLEPNFNDQKKLFKYCKNKNIIFLSTPYDEQSADFLDSLGVEIFKIASTDTTNHLFLRYIARKKKPVILSTGLSNSNHVNEAVKIFEKENMKNKLFLLHTTSDYPAPNNDVNLLVIPEFLKRYRIPIGYSDHTQTDVASMGAIALGARILEKHFTLDRNLPGPDQSSSLEPNELKEWIKKIRLMEISLGSSKKSITNSEKKNLSMRKIIIIKPIKKDTKITLDVLSAMRGKNGILPLNSNLKKIIGKKITKDIKSTQEFSWKMIK